MNLALFDLDNTLLAGDSDFEWAQFLISRGVVDREIQEAKNLAFYEQYKAGTLDIQEFLAFQLMPLTRHPRSELDAAVIRPASQAFALDPGRIYLHDERFVRGRAMHGDKKRLLESLKSVD